MTIEERLYILKEMKECSLENANELSRRGWGRDPAASHRLGSTGRSFSGVSEQPSEQVTRRLTDFVKSFLLRCLLCGVVVAGIVSGVKGGKLPGETVGALSQRITRQGAWPDWMKELPKTLEQGKEE